MYGGHASLQPGLRSAQEKGMSRKHFRHGLLARNAQPLRTARWFFKDFVLRHRGSLAWITALGAGAAALQGGTMFLLNDVIRGGAGGGSLLAAAIGDAGAGQGVALLAGVVLLTLSGSALLLLFQGWQILSLWRRYQLHAMNALLQAVQAASARGALDERSAKKPLIPSALRQSQRVGALTRVVASTVTPALRFVAFSAFAISVEPALTVVLFLAAIPSGALTLFLFARRASQSARQVQALSRDAKKELNRRLDQALANRLELLDERDQGADSSVVMRVSALIERLVWVENARFATAQLTILLLAGLIIVAGYAGSASPTSWGGVLLYVFALMLAFTQLANLASALSTFGRFYPYVTHHMTLLTILHAATSPEDFQERAQRERLTDAFTDDLDDEAA